MESAPLSPQIYTASRFRSRVVTGSILSATVASFWVITPAFPVALFLIGLSIVAAIVFLGQSRSMVAITHDRLEISTGKGVSVFPLDEIDRVEKRGRGSVALIDTHGQERLIPPYLDRSEELFSRLSAVAEENRLALSYSSDDQLAKNANLELV